jgi:DNA-3-methyladenine glycosylase II
MIQQFSRSDYQSICDVLAAKDPHLDHIIKTYGYPPFWSRPNSFESLVHIILEQQVSLSSALSALNKLRERLGEISPASVLQLSGEEMRACYVSRQKSTYIKHLAEAILSHELDLQAFDQLPDDEVREKLTALKGIGNWTADVYLMFALGRADIFPMGDLAAASALKQVKQLPKDVSGEEMLIITGQWKPYRSLAAMILWHYYLSRLPQNSGGLKK